MLHCGFAYKIKKRPHLGGKIWSNEEHFAFPFPLIAAAKEKKNYFYSKKRKEKYVKSRVKLPPLKAAPHYYTKRRRRVTMKP